MSRTLFALAGISAFLALGSAALAQATPAASVPLAPWVAMLSEVINPAATILVPLVAAWGVRTFSRNTHLKAVAQWQATIQTAATNGAGRLLAATEGDISRMSIPVGSPAVVAEAATVAGLVPDAISGLGIRPDQVGITLANLIAGKVGILQSAATDRTVTPAAPGGA